MRSDCRRDQRRQRRDVRPGSDRDGRSPPPHTTRNRRPSRLTPTRYFRTRNRSYRSKRHPLEPGGTGPASSAHPLSALATRPSTDRTRNPRGDRRVQSCGRSVRIGSLPKAYRPAIRRALIRVSQMETGSCARSEPVASFIRDDPSDVPRCTQNRENGRRQEDWYPRGSERRSRSP